MQFTVGREAYEKLRRVQDLLRHRVPNGDPAVIFERAITLLLKDLEKKKIAATERPRHSVSAGKHSRHIPCTLVSLATRGAGPFYERLGYRSKAEYYKKYLAVKDRV